MIETKQEQIILSTGNINDKYEVKGIAHIEVKISEAKLKNGWADLRIAEVYSNMNTHFISAANILAVMA